MFGSTLVGRYLLVTSVAIITVFVPEMALAGNEPCDPLFERRIFDDINSARAANGRPILRWDAGAAIEADTNSLRMLQRRTDLTHEDGHYIIPNDFWQNTYTGTMKRDEILRNGVWQQWNQNLPDFSQYINYSAPLDWWTSSYSTPVHKENIWGYEWRRGAIGCWQFSNIASTGSLTRNREVRRYVTYNVSR